tara:strand:- start:742 stop:915 length:174 start_codon:yes stop_codon:yes gene_type:complete
MIEFLIACSPRLDGKPTFCPPNDYILERKAPKPRIIEDKDLTNPFDYVKIPIWRYEF